MTRNVTSHPSDAGDADSLRGGARPGSPPTSAAVAAIEALGSAAVRGSDGARLRAALRSGGQHARSVVGGLVVTVLRLVIALAAERRGQLRGLGAPRHARGAATGDFADAVDAVDAAHRIDTGGSGDVDLDADALAAARDRLLQPHENGRFSTIDEVAARPEQLGRLYEQLLDLDATLTPDGTFVATRRLGDRAGARSRGGSHYTPDELVRVLIDGALEPAIAACLARASGRADEALLDLSIVDPACGAGHLLLAAARTLAAHVARSREGPAPPPAARAVALREVIERSIFGVDVDPVALELCQATLWLEARAPLTTLGALARHTRVGDALLGAPRDHAPPSAHRSDAPLAHRRAADAWCAARLSCDDAERARPLFHWHLEFTDVFARGGFDVVLGNPPWLAHAGRAARPLHPATRAFLARRYEAFAGYPTTHGAFVALATELARPGGALGLLVPSSLADLRGYEPTRRAHDRRCELDADLFDLGEGRFEGVTQPCMALVSRRVEGGRSGARHGAPWPIARPDLSPVERRLLDRLASLAPLPPSSFGERGLQSDATRARHIAASPAPLGRFTVALREGCDVRAFELLPPRLHADPAGLGRHLRSPDAFRAVRVLVRQTAAYPIAALSDGLAFRNSLLAGFDCEGLPPEALVALLNASLVRWAHHQRFREARQPILPQVKIGHLRAVPAPPDARGRDIDALATLGLALTDRPVGTDAAPLLDALDALVARLYALDDAETIAVERWRDRHVTRPQGTP